MIDREDQFGPEYPKGPWPGDAYLRDACFTILERPKHGPARWTRNGKEYLEEDALAIAFREEPKRKEAAEARKAATDKAERRSR